MDRIKTLKNHYRVNLQGGHTRIGAPNPFPIVTRISTTLPIWCVLQLILERQ